VLDASLQSLLRRDELAFEPRVVLITPEDASPLLTTERENLPRPIVELKLPCIAAMSRWLLLRCFDLGADAVGILPCGSACRHRCRPELWQRVIGFVQALLTELGVVPERLRVFSLSAGEPQLLANRLRAFVEELKELGPTRICNGNGKAKALNLVDLLKGLSRGSNVHGTCIVGDDVPFGIVTTKTGDRTCTLCGACQDSCPTGAITLQEGGGLSKLLFDHGGCIACEACVKVCPEQVLGTERALDFPRLVERIILAEDRMALCRRCGKEIAPLAMTRKILDQLTGEKGNAPSGLGKFCPDCRIFGNLYL
jgi:ferredoxin